MPLALRWGRVKELRGAKQVVVPRVPSCPNGRIATFFLCFLRWVTCGEVTRIVSYASAVILSRCGPSECVIVALSSLSPFLTHFFHAVSGYAPRSNRSGAIPLVSLPSASPQPR